MSSKHKDKSIQDWITKNKNIRIYASYSNNENSFADYPAMYENVIGVGSSTYMTYKGNDIIYQSKRLICFYNMNLSYYEGNSFLSLYSVLYK